MGQGYGEVQERSRVKAAGSFCVLLLYLVLSQGLSKWPRLASNFRSSCLCPECWDNKHVHIQLPRHF